MIGEVIGKVLGSLLPVQAELIFLDAAANPVKLHVKSLGAFLAHVVGEDAVGGRAVGLDWGGRLRVTHIGEYCADGNGLMAVEGLPSTTEIGRAS